MSLTLVINSRGPFLFMAVNVAIDTFIVSFTNTSEKLTTSFNDISHTFIVNVRENDDGDKNSKYAINFLNDISYSLPEIKTILQQYGLDSFKSIDSSYEMKGNKRIVHRGLGEISPQDHHDRNADVIATNASDSYQNPTE